MKKSFTEVVAEEDFLELAQEHSHNFLNIYHFLHEQPKALTRRFYAHLIEESEELESFLDDHCARDNKAWYLFSELVACTRNLAKVVFILKHVINRYPAYELNGSQIDELLGDVQKVSSFLDKKILSFYEEIRKESTRLGIIFPKEGSREDLFQEMYAQKRLPYTIDEEEDFNARKILAKIATQYLNVIKRFEFFGWNCGKRDVNEMKETILDKVNEERSREIIASIHNIQSTYDHYMRHTPLESQDEQLKRFRGLISIALHMLSVVNWLSHLFQRHLHPTRRERDRVNISHVISEDDILDIMLNFALYYADFFLQIGKQFATDILDKYTEIDMCELKVPKKLGFHLRPATLVAKLAKYYGTKLSLIVDSREYDASNVLSITMAAGLIARKGYKTVRFKGDRRVLQDLTLLSEYNYGEDERGNPISLPQEFSHLWS